MRTCVSNNRMRTWRAVLKAMKATKPGRQSTKATNSKSACHVAEIRIIKDECPNNENIVELSRPLKAMHEILGILRCMHVVDGGPGSEADFQSSGKLPVEERAPTVQVIANTLPKSHRGAGRLQVEAACDKLMGMFKGCSASL